MIPKELLVFLTTFLFLTSRVNSLPNCLDQHEFELTMFKLLGISSWDELFTDEKNDGQRKPFREFIFKKNNQIMTVIHYSGTEHKLIQNEQRFLALFKSLKSYKYMPRLLTCVKLDNNYLLLYQFYGESLKDVLENGKQIARADRYFIYNKLAHILMQFEADNIIFNNLNFSSIRFFDRKKESLGVVDFSHSYILANTCISNKNQFWPVDIIHTSGDFICTHMVQLLSLVAYMEHLSSNQAFYFAQDSFNSRVNHYCQNKYPDQLQIFVCSQLSKSHYSDDDIRAIKSFFNILVQR